MLFCIVSLFISCWFLNASAASPPKTAQELKITVEYAREGKNPWAVVWLDMRAEYHAYANDIGGNTGKPTVLTAKAQNGKALTVIYPTGELRRDMYAPSKMVRVYAVNKTLFVRLDELGPGEAVQGTVQLLLCSVKHCMPVTRSLTLELPAAGVDALPPLPTQSWAEAWKAAMRGSRTGEISGNAISLSGSNVTAGDAVSLSGSGSAMSIVSTDAPPSEKPAALVTDVSQAGTGWTFAPRSVQEDTEVRGLGKALLLGLLAGLLLNCMPCVLPVLTLKASAMLVVGGGDKEERLHRFREHNLFFAAGILTQFFLLAVILGTAGLIWGQLFQSATFVSAMLVIVFLLGLSMLGLFTLPVIDLKAGSTNSPRLQAFFTGIMATLLATPCSGPLLGGVLSWAFMQPLSVLIVIFLAVGLGMSVPYFIFAARPELAVFLPRPGKWMEVLERLVGFFLLGTSLYLLSILPQEQHLSLLAALLLVAVGGWVWGSFGGYNAPRWRRNLLGGFLTVLVLGVVFFAARPPVQEHLWESFDAATFRAELGKAPMLVEFTADWCPNCKFLERTTLTSRRLRNWQKAYGLRLVRVDLTRPNPEAEALLQALGSSSIPLTAIFTKGLTSSAPVVLRDIYSADTLSSALRKAFK